MEQVQCRHFNGYKPCGLHSPCSEKCPSRNIPDTRILMVHLEALGAVLRATALLPAIFRKYPKAHVTWLTKAPAQHLLQGNPWIDRILTLDVEGLLALENLQFDLAFCLDKSLVASGVLKRTRFKELRGFRSELSGSIVPANPEAKELWDLGLNNDFKFFRNQKSETQLLHEALALGNFQRDSYVLALSETEKKVAQLRKGVWAPRGEIVVGINTGCAPTIPYKKLSVEGHRSLLQILKRQKGIQIVLLGGKEDTARNRQIAEGFDVHLSPTESGLRDGITSMEACDIVISGDSLGMHMGIALKKWVIAWFGPTCSQEIDLFDRGEKIRTQASCSPCWKRSCHKEIMCYDQVSMDHIFEAVVRGVKWKSSLSKPHSLEISSSASL